MMSEIANSLQIINISCEGNGSAQSASATLLVELSCIRDNALQSHATTDGRTAEEEYLSPVVLEQPSNRPDMQPLDYGFWSLIAKQMRKHERAWQKRHPKSSWDESLEDYKARLKKTALRLTKKEWESISV